MEQATGGAKIEKLAQLIKQDIGLSGTLLKVVNCETFGLKKKIVSIEKAVEELGVDSVINIINGLAIKSELSDEAIVSLSRFWDCATDVALVSAAIAEHIKFQNVDEAYAVGLFHCCGMPLLMLRYPDYHTIIEKAYASKDERLIDTENRHFNTNHAVVGYYVTKSWNLPDHICELISEQYNLGTIFHQNNRFSYNSHKKNLLAILKIAQDVCGIHLILGGQETNRDWQRYGEAILEHIGLSQYDFEGLKDGFDDMSSIL